MREQFSRFVGPVIDKVLGLRCTSYGYQYSEIADSLSSAYFCGGNCVEYVTSHLMPHLSLYPALRTCSSDTILRGNSELSCANTTCTSDTGKVYDFNTATKLNSLLVKVPINTGQLMAGASYDLDFDHQFSISTSVPTAAAHSMTDCWHCVDRSEKRSTASSMR